MDDRIVVELAYAREKEHTLIALSVRKGATIRDLITMSGILSYYPEIKMDDLVCGIFGHIKSPADTVAAGDRVEIYRPLTVDPKEARRARARQLLR